MGFIIYGNENFFVVFLFFYMFGKVVVFVRYMLEKKIGVVVVGFLVIFFVEVWVWFCVLVVYIWEMLDIVLEVFDEMGDFL